MAKVTHTSRIEESDLDLALKKGLDLPNLFREALAKALRTNRCPTCGHRLQPVKKARKPKRAKVKLKKKLKRPRARAR